MESKKIKIMPLNPKKEKKENQYSAKDIYVLKGLEPVRKRPGMYIGSTGTEGLHHLIWEVLDNGIDECLAGCANEIKVFLMPGNKVKGTDNGRGIPVEIHPQTKKSALETVMTTLHAGGKFGGEAYKVSGGLHGVGVSVVCALSKWMRVEVCRDGNQYSQEYSRGKPKTKVQKFGKCRQTGTSVCFEPDPEIFKEIKFDLKKILSHLRQQAYLTRKVKISVIDQREKPEKLYTFYFEGGLASYVKHLVRGVKKRHPIPYYGTGEKNGILVEVAFQYTEEYEFFEESFTNNINTIGGGTHLTGFKSALTRTFNDYAKKNNFLKNNDDNLSGEDIREGLTSVVSIKLKDPQFEGQTKAKLGNPEAKTAVETVVSETLDDFLERNPQDARLIIEKCLLSSRARKAARAARETVLRKGILDGLALPGKLADCSSKKPEESELYIVEGDSAGGCFSSDTKVALTDGRNLNFRQLIKEDEAGKINYCYTIKKDGSIGVELIKNPRKTKKSTKVIKVVLDNGEEIVCTLDHNFMMRDGSYKNACNLVPSDSLMPFRRQLSRLGKRKTTYNQTYQDKALKLLREILEKKEKINKENYDKERLERRDKSLLKYETVCQRFFKNNEDNLKEAVYNYNHKIKKIVKLKEKIDVYDLEVKDTHNFALSSGVFVHNSAKQARDRRFQAILPLRGKILNVEKSRLDKILASKEIKSLIIALGTAIAEDFKIEKLRYHRIILMQDADVDGSHIRTLLLTFFYRYFKELIEQGYLYIAQPPLYCIQVGKKIEYAYTDQDKNKILKKIEKQKSIGLSVQRYKGLGEMNPEQLWETTMDPEKRVLLKVHIEDVKEADRIFDILMGDEVLPRKKFIQAHAKNVKNLDV